MGRSAIVAAFTAFARATAGGPRPAGAWPGAAVTAFTTFFRARGEIVGPVRFVSQTQGRGAFVF